VSIGDKAVQQQTSSMTGYPTATVVATAVYPTATAVATISLHNPNNTMGESPAARLQKLENMKHLLSTQEYKDKRADILAAV
jgi:Spy/CpxP family protein refolding chaperone